MYKFMSVFIFAIILAMASAKPAIIAPAPYSEVIASPYVVNAATSSQYVARNYNGYAYVDSAPLLSYTSLPYTSYIL
ncbi:hypothetical protein PVAND_007312 [Polypedilum vanderplanki]|uniref:Uncharacterized protein n=1 Tax=Polypedilum vanderplanki TaxID=319348 RepID=A0A9J6C6A5_POLVA|nr:hypothetical protein PVAND_007312 [Polypedilum vanderplanki]